MATVKDMLSKDIKLLQLEGSLSRSAWHLAAMYGRVAVLQALTDAVMACGDNAQQLLNSSLRSAAYEALFLLGSGVLGSDPSHPGGAARGP